MRAIIIVIAILILGSCKNQQKTEYTAIDKGIVSHPVKDLPIHPGKKLMETYCYSCHSPTASEQDRIAPPMIAIKKHYITNNITKEDFKKSMQDWMANPNEKDAKMFGAVRRFGVMPKMIVPEKTVQQIADYLYDYAIEEPEWFEEHYNRERGHRKSMRRRMGKGMGRNQSPVSSQNLSYEERGLNYALATKAELGKNLMTTIQNKGTQEAVKFCNNKAYPLTDSMSIVNNATIKRVSDKPRNIKNTANAKELGHIKTFKYVIANKQEPQPIIEETKSLVNFYYPITTNAMCLQCHGNPKKDIQSKTLKALNALYPNDKATGYGINEVRGMWHITFAK